MGPLGILRRMRIRPAHAAALAAVTVILVACGSSDSGTAGGVDLSDKEFVDETGTDAVEVDAVDNNFRPPYIEIDAGTTVTFVNDGRNDHNVIPVVDGAFPEIPTEDFEPEDTGEVTFDEAGDYPYYCSLHGTKTKGMVGAIKVVEPRE